MDRVTVSNARHRILHGLKVGGESTTAALADMLGLSEMTLRQHFETLERLELVKRRLQSRKVPGRRAILWTLTELSSREFPERHAELTVALLDAARETFGEDGLSKIIESRADREVEAYKGLMPRKSASLRRKIDALARQRTLEGYMAEVVREGKGAYLLIEHHCPICEAARCCVGLCAAELRVFQEALGPKVTVERTRHVIKGDDRCVYRISGP